MNRSVGPAWRLKSSLQSKNAPLLIASFVVVAIIVGWLIPRYTIYFSLLAVALAGSLVFAGTALFIARDPFRVLSIVLLLMPFHTIVDNLVRRVVGSGLIELAFSSWKELALLLIFLLVFLHRLFRGENLSITPLAVLAVIFVAFGLLSIPTAYSLRIGLLEYRNLYEGMLILVTIYALRPPLERVLRLFNWMLVEGVLLSIWGFVGRYVLDFYTYLQSLGFIEPEMTRIQLQYGSVFSISGSLFLRANSIFSGPNEFGLYLAILIVFAAGLLFFNRHEMSRKQRRRYVLALAVIGVGELISISRNSWVFIALALLVMFARMRLTKQKLQIALLAFCILVGMLVAVPNLWRFVVRTINLEDSSSAGRVTLLHKGLSEIMANPLGIGLGNASYKLHGLRPNGVHTEFYFFIIALELGWPGLALYLLMMGAFTRKCLRLTRASYPFERRLFGLIGAGLLLGTLASQFLAAITMEWIFQIYLWLFIGTAIFGRSSNGSKALTTRVLDQ